ncbi:MAG: CHAD domain-containing protein [Elusimicrobia bacterium]|nr:CHAD domain-containing protein [Elusimicrobiota bacterium]
MDKRLPVGEAAAGLARHWLGQAWESARLIQRGSDAKALHDFRTSVRRLRVALSAYRDCLGPAGARPLRERLRKISHATSPARDAQVWSVWLKRHGAPCEITRRLIVHLEAVAAHCRQDFLRQGLPEFESAARQLEARLARVQPGRLSFGAAASAAIRAAAKRLDRRLKAVRRGGTPAQMHAARIRVKRLRYLLEPFTRIDAGVRKLVGRLRQLQDLFGKLHDLHELADCGVPPASEPARLEARRLERDLRRRWLKTGRDKRLISAAQRWSA